MKNIRLVSILVMFIFLSTSIAVYSAEKVKDEEASTKPATVPAVNKAPDVGSTGSSAGTKFGLGISLEQNLPLIAAIDPNQDFSPNFPLYQVLIPIKVSPIMIIEPRLAFGTMSAKDENDDPVPESKYNFFGLGLGGHYFFNPLKAQTVSPSVGAMVDFYSGKRTIDVPVVIGNNTYTLGTEHGWTAIDFGLMFGTTYSFTDTFLISAHAGLGYISVNYKEEETTMNATNDGTETTTNTDLKGTGIYLKYELALRIMF